MSFPGAFSGVRDCSLGSLASPHHRCKTRQKNTHTQKKTNQTRVVVVSVIPDKGQQVYAFVYIRSGTGFRISFALLTVFHLLSSLFKSSVSIYCILLFLDFVFVFTLNSKKKNVYFVQFESTANLLKVSCKHFFITL